MNNDTATQQSFGAWVVALRDRLGWSQGDLAKALEVDRSSVSLWERTGRMPINLIHKKLAALATLHDFPPPPPRAKQRRS